MKCSPPTGLRFNVGVSRKRLSRAFSLVEVVLAVGVVGFAFIGILGLLPAGMSQFRQAIDTTVCAGIAQKVISDAQQMDFDTLTNSSLAALNTPLRYFDERGKEIMSSGSAEIIYHVNMRVLPQPLGVAGSIPQATLATVTVQIANNPGNLPVPISNNLFLPKKGVSTLTYSAQIARNQ